MKKFLLWFNNHSIRFKIVVLLFILILFLQMINGSIFISNVTKKFEENISASNLATVEQMKVNINGALEDIVKEMIPIRDEILSYQFSSNEMNSQNEYLSRNILYQEMFNNLLAEDNNYQFINSMIILGENDVVHSFRLNNYGSLNNEHILERLLKDYKFKEQCQWSDLVSESYYFNGLDEKIISIIMPIYRYKTVKNFLIVNLRVDGLQEYLREICPDDSNVLIQIDKKEFVFANEGDANVWEPEEVESLITNEAREEVADSKDYIVITKKLPINSWKISMVLTKNSISNSTKAMSEFIIFILLSTGVVMLVGVTSIILIVVKPINKMISIMESNSHDKDMKQRFNIKYNDEVGALALTYNHMMDEIHQLMIDIEKEQIQNRKTYFNMLQLQIKPHFLYNSLEAAKFLVEMNDPMGSDMLTAIGKFYKLSLNGINDKCSIREEIEHLSYYQQILKMRYNSKYEYEISIDEGILDQEIVRFTLQPLVENAIYHGIKQKRQKGLLRVTGQLEDENVVITIWDNGAGIPKDKLENIQNNLRNSKGISAVEHIGIINVHQRINIHYGENYGIWIDSIQNEYTEVKVKLPYRKDMNSHV